MIELLKDFYTNVISKKRFWIPVLFMTIASYGFSIFNRTLCADDLATWRYVDGKVWIRELRWGAVLWKKIFSYADAVPFLDKYLSIMFLMGAATLFSCIWYYLNGQKKWIWQYTAVSCMFVTYPILCEIWQYTCGGTIIVPGDFFLTFLAILLVATSGEKISLKRFLLAGAIMTLVSTSAESLAPCYIATVLMILFYRYCVCKNTPIVNENRTAQETSFPAPVTRAGLIGWIFDGLRYAFVLVFAMVLRFVIGYGILRIMNLTFQHQGDTTVRWPLTGAEIKLMIGQFLTNYIGGALIYIPITVFVVCVVMFILICLFFCVRNKSGLPLFLGICIGISLFLIMIVQGQVMWYRTAITLIIFCSFVVYLLMEHAGNRLHGTSPVSGLRRNFWIAVTILVFYVCWRQAAYANKMLALDNLRSENEAATAKDLGFYLTSEFDTSKPMVFVGNYDIGHKIWLETTASLDMGSRRKQMFIRIRRKLTGSDNSYSFVQSYLYSTLDWYHYEFDGELFSDYFAYYGYDFNIVSNLTDEEEDYYNSLADEMDLRTFKAADMGDYILVRIGRLD